MTPLIEATPKEPDFLDGRRLAGFPGTPEALGRITAAHVQRFDHSGRPVAQRPLRVLGAYALVLLLEGEGRYRDETGVDVSLVPGDLIVIRPEIAHRYGPRPGELWVERYVVFEGPVFDLWGAAGLLDLSPPVVNLAPVSAWNAELDALLHQPGGSDAPSALEQVCGLQHLLTRILERSGYDSLSAKDHDWLSTACSLLDADETRTMDLVEVATRLAISYDGFRKRFRRLSGTSPARYRDERRIAKARSLIQSGDLTSAQIAERLGFYDEQHFSRRFKQVVGKSPRQFRASLPAPD